jgi:cell fate (sporulation/competence/biofilm development) regulator YlbF (YheA/YmcA/DUF963 family)
MNPSDHHPAEIEFRNMLTEVRQLIEKYEDKFLDGDEKEVLKKELKPIKQRLFDLQMERFSQYINDRGKVENMPEDEVRLQKAITDLTTRISRLIPST